MEKFYHPVLTEYSCNRNGDVFGKSGEQLHGCVTALGYRQYGFSNKTIVGHRFIWECINGLIDADLVVNHIDADKLNNRIENLELVTQEGNVHHHYSNFWDNPNKDVDLSGSRYRTSKVKLSKEDARKVILMCFEGYTNRQIADKFGVHDRYVSLIRHKKRWKAMWLELGLESSTTIPSGSTPK